MHVASLLILGPEDIVGYLGFRIEFHAFEDVLCKLLVSGTVNQVAAMEVLGLVVKDPGGEFLPVGEYAKDHVLCYPVQEKFSSPWILLAGTAAQGYTVEFLGSPGPCAGGTD